MKVKIGNTLYDSTEQPIMLILSQAEKENIAMMEPEATRYCSAPIEMAEDEIRAFMNQDVPQHSESDN